MLAWIVHKELTLRNRRRPEGVGFDNVRSGLQKPAMNVANQLRLRQRKQIAVVEQVFLRVLESLAANLRLFHPVGADGRPRRAIDDGDAASQHRFQRVIGRLSHFFPMVYALHLQHIERAAHHQPIRTEQRQPALGCRNRCLNGIIDPACKQ